MHRSDKLSNARDSKDSNSSRTKRANLHQAKKRMSHSNRQLYKTSSKECARSTLLSPVIVASSQGITSSLMTKDRSSMQVYSI